jgi:hypothetical protein
MAHQPATRRGRVRLRLMAFTPTVSLPEKVGRIYATQKAVAGFSPATDLRLLSQK